MLIAFQKPYGVLSRFTGDGSRWRTLADFGLPSQVYPIGRLDADSEGLLLLSDEQRWNAELLDPHRAHPRTYWVQVDRVPSAEALFRLASGLDIQGSRTRRAQAWLLCPPLAVPPRDPPIRHRKAVPDCWIGLKLTEGRNRQVRRMTAAVGHPTLRLIRVQIGEYAMGDFTPGHWTVLGAEARRSVLAKPGADLGVDLSAAGGYPFAP